MDKVKPFYFVGNLSASKSLMNRALIIQSFFPHLRVVGESGAEDVINLKNSLDLFKNGESKFSCGAGGTSFRFLLARLSRESGEFHINISKRLMERPHDELYFALEKLGSRVKEQGENTIVLSSQGWSCAKPIPVSLEKSSQFLSALLLSSWDLPKPVSFAMVGGKNSLSYLEMTISLLEQLGMNLHKKGQQLTVPARQKLAIDRYQVEPDMSSSFALAALALANGKLILQNFAKHSLQPDFVWTHLVQSLGGQLEFEEGDLHVNKSVLVGGDFDLTRTPDLFPVLSILLSRAQGPSILTGLEVLKYKESDRWAKACELLRKLGIEFESGHDFLKITGVNHHEYPPAFDFDPDHDHRLAMAAALAIHQGAAIHILNRDVVNKSFPGFWKLAGL